MLMPQLGGGPGGFPDLDVGAEGGGPGGLPGGPADGGPVGGPDGGSEGSENCSGEGATVGAFGGPVGGPVGAVGVAGVAGAAGGAGGADGAGACCDAKSPPAKAACIGSSEVASVSSTGAFVSSSSPNPSNAVPKAAANGSLPETFTLVEERLEGGDCRSGRADAAILISLVKGPSSTEPGPESVL